MKHNYCLKSCLVLLLLFFVFGYILLYYLMSHSEEVYGFTVEEVKFERGIVWTKFLGKHHTGVDWRGRYVIKRSPYELIVSIKDPGKSGTVRGVVRIKRLYLTDKETGKVLYEKTDTPAIPVVGGLDPDGKHIYKRLHFERKDMEFYSDSYAAGFWFMDVDLEYKGVDLYVEFSIEDEGKKTEYKAELSFETDYTPRHRETTMY